MGFAIGTINRELLDSLTTRVMPDAETWRYRGQTIDREQIAFMREFIREHPHSSRWKLSRQLCEALDWKQANGATAC